MDYTEQGQSIVYLVNKAGSRKEAEQMYAELEGLMMPEETADSIFKNAVDQKFPEGGVPLQKDPEFLSDEHAQKNPVAKLKAMIPVLEAIEEINKRR